MQSKVYWLTQVVLLIHRPGKKYLIGIWCKLLIKIFWEKYQARLIGISREAKKPNLHAGRIWGNAFSSQHPFLIIETVIFLCSGEMIKNFFIHYIWCLKNKVASFNSVLFMFGKATSILHIHSTFSITYIFFFTQIKLFNNTQ